MGGTTGTSNLERALDTSREMRMCTLSCTQPSHMACMVGWVYKVGVATGPLTESGGTDVLGAAVGRVSHGAQKAAHLVHLLQLSESCSEGGR